MQEAICNLRSKRETEEVLRVDISDSREAAGAEKEMNEFWGGFRFSYGLTKGKDSGFLQSGTKYILHQPELKDSEQ